MEYSQLEPKDVFKYFEEISQIPRGSGNEKAISDYLVKFAKERNLEVLQDESYNVIIRKPASKGYENAKGVILQGHMDMVPEKGENSTHDFEKDPIELIVDGDNLHANDTTLGADDGIGVAMALAILDSDTIAHAPLEVLVTVSEETDLGGAQALSDKVLKGDYLINIDSEEEGIMTVGSAGGELYMAYFTPELSPTNEYKTYEFNFSGFMGGHSGVEIANPKGNMVVVMADFVENLKDSMLVDFIVGTKDNAIPRLGKVKLAIKNTNGIDELITSLKEKYSNIEGELKIIYNEIETPSEAQSIESTNKFAKYLLSLPTGVNSFTDETKTFVASSSNLAIVTKKDNGKYEVWNSMRFNKGDLMTEFKNKFNLISEEYNVEYNYSNYYPEWEYKEDSNLRALTMKLYKEMYGKEMTIDITHGGLECGVFYIKYKNLDMISIGPDISGAHTPQETLSIPSTKRVYEFTLELLKNLK
ncbi:aminoacyl-histidine dipeptidase [Peptoniphilus mikwangii]|uniref:aminoacyl-histidine dipeptidase n=1 Tax=Peptoniphilus mikwangii TaxID=1354300 RepID=UPI00041A0ECB|nr:aminoacyl-histidine dipeptidase [Peptoniphilus mikwangii]